MYATFYSTYAATFSKECALSENALAVAFKSHPTLGKLFMETPQDGWSDLIMKHMPDLLEHVYGLAEGLGFSLPAETGEVCRIRDLYESLYRHPCPASVDSLRFYISHFGTRNASAIYKILDTISMLHDREYADPESLPMTVQALKLLVPEHANSGEMTDLVLHGMIAETLGTPHMFQNLQDLITSYNQECWVRNGVGKNVMQFARQAIATFGAEFGTDLAVSEWELVEQIFCGCGVFDEQTFLERKEEWLWQLYQKHRLYNSGMLKHEFQTLFGKRYGLFLPPKADILADLNETLFACRVITVSALTEKEAKVCWYHLSHHYRELGEYLLSAAVGIAESAHCVNCNKKNIHFQLLRSQVESFQDLVRTAPTWCSSTEEALLNGYSTEKCTIIWGRRSRASQGGMGQIDAYRNNYAAWAAFCELLNSGYDDVATPMAKHVVANDYDFSKGQLYLEVKYQYGKWNEAWKPIVESVLAEMAIVDQVEFWAKFNFIVVTVIERIICVGDNNATDSMYEAVREAYAEAYFTELKVSDDELFAAMCTHPAYGKELQDIGDDLAERFEYIDSHLDNFVAHLFIKYYKEQSV